MTPEQQEAAFDNLAKQIPFEKAGSVFFHLVGSLSVMKNMTPENVLDAIKRAKEYIDFGNI